MDDLLKGLQAGDAGAFERFVREFGDRIFRFVGRLVGPRWAEDLTQEVFLRIHRSVGKYRPTGSFKAWIFTLANNVCIDFLRKRRLETAELPEAQAGPESGPVDALTAVELRDAVLRAVERLPVEQRQVFLLREEAGLAFREIAEVVGCPLNTALGRMHYALLSLRKTLAAFKE
ncbi:MAG: RNA polymerase sigma factor [Planctomycetota bacterium]|jgi:RNA polymerase sigma-70 factor (ECF subfamily)